MKILIIGIDFGYNAEFFNKKTFEKLGQEIILLDEYRDIKNPFITKILHTRKGLFNHSFKNFKREFTRFKLKIDRLTFILLIFLNNYIGVLLKPLQI